FSVPDIWWSNCCRNAKGYFGYEDVLDATGKQSGIITWCRFKMKHAWLTNDQNVEYYWPKLNMFSRWYRSTSHTVVIVFDPKPHLRQKFTSCLHSNIDPRELHDPFWIYPRLVEEIVLLQDEAVTRIRNLVREIEKNRADQNSPTAPNPCYQRLHEVMRHAIHVSETLSVACATVQSIQLYHERLLAERKTTHGISKNIASRLSFHLHMLGSLRQRSDSSRARLGSEISLAFNTVAQYDSRTSARIADAMRSDSAAMRTIAVVTLIFLPTTFVSAVFSTSFFDFDARTGAWAISDRFWVFWAISIPLTGLSVSIWFFWKPLARLIFGIRLY
ncbi:hypothetical protein B0T10DRAFT_573012, partial [Thelonectria olida]